MTEIDQKTMREGTMAVSNNLVDMSSVKVVIPEHVLFQRLDGEAVLLDVQTGGYFGLNGVGTLVWQLLAEGKSIGAVVSEICGHYEIGMAQAASDTRAFISALQQQALVALSDD